MIAFSPPSLRTGKTTSEKKLVARLFNWRWISVILLGFTSNLLINIVLDYKYQRSLVSLSLEETINAIVAAFVLLEGMRWITRRLNRHLPWQSAGVRKRLAVQLGIHLVFLIVALNVLLISVTWLFYGGFYEFGDLMVINISVVSTSFFFTLIDTGIYFFNNWKKAARKPPLINGSGTNTVQLSLGKSRYLINQKDIKSATSRSGLVIVRTSDERKLPYSGSLDTLMTKLDSRDFFKANRQVILNHSVIKSHRPLEYGKIQVELADSSQNPVTISRTRAASFRKWLNTHSA